MHGDPSHLQPHTCVLVQVYSWRDVWILWWKQLFDMIAMFRTQCIIPSCRHQRHVTGTSITERMLFVSGAATGTPVNECPRELRALQSRLSAGLVLRSWLVELDIFLFHGLELMDLVIHPSRSASDSVAQSSFPSRQESLSGEIICLSASRFYSQCGRLWV